MNTRIQVAPSILAADFSQLGAEAARLEAAGADALHIDVMDGHFVRNLTMGSQVVAALRAHTKMFLDVHLMIYQPFDFIDKFAAAGANRITFHFEATEDVTDTIQLIKGYGLEAGLAFCPETSDSFIVDFLDQIDLLLIMTVNPGFGGQPFIHDMLQKITFAHKALQRQTPVAIAQHLKRSDLSIQVDGGINDQTGQLCRRAGADNIVAGTWLFAQPDMSAAIAQLRGDLIDDKR